MRDEEGGSDHGQPCSLALTVTDSMSLSNPGCSSVGLEKSSSVKSARLMGVGNRNESVPVVIRLLPKKAKKARKKKKPERVLTHDEQVEGRNSAKLDLDLEMEFFESLQ